MELDLDRREYLLDLYGKILEDLVKIPSHSHLVSLGQGLV